MRIGDLDALKEAIADAYPSFNQRMQIKDVFEAIKNAPTIDAVPVVRCKDCRFFYRQECTRSKVEYRKRTDYCSKGERRDDE